MTALGVGIAQVLVAGTVVAGLLVVFVALALAALHGLRAPRDDALEHLEGHPRLGIDNKRGARRLREDRHRAP